MLLTPKEIFIAFRDWLLNDSKLVWKQSRRVWTPKIKDFFGKLGDNCGYHSIHTKKGEKEYLTDLVWRLDGPKQFLILSMESELSGKRKEIIEDFRKLVDVKSDIKIGIFQLNSKRESEILYEIRKILNSQHLFLLKEIYIIIFFRYDYDNNRITLVCYDVEMSGASTIEIYNDSHPFPEI